MQEQENNEIHDALLSLSDAREILDILYIINALLKNEGNVTHAS